ncbi:hypothetical protein D3C84_940090 [compost metagenome]
MLVEYAEALFAPLNEPQRHRHHHGHVHPQTAEVVGRQALAQDEVQWITDDDQQGRPGKTTHLIQLVEHAEGSKEHRHLLQVGQTLAIGDPPGQDHGQR